MKQQKTVENRVLEILKECPMSRYDDMLLILHYYNRYGYIPAGNLPLEDIVFNYRAYGLPCFETIAGQGREYSPFFLSIHVIRRKKNRAAVFLL